MPFKVRKRDDWTEQSLYEYAVGALGRRMRTVAELKRLMRQRVEKSELGDALIELVVRRLKDHGYLNDTDYAATYTSLRRDNEKFGRMRVITELKTRGVHGDIIEKTVGAAYEGVNEEKQAREFLHRKRLRELHRLKAHRRCPPHRRQGSHLRLFPHSKVSHRSGVPKMHLRSRRAFAT